MTNTPAIHPLRAESSVVPFRLPPRDADSFLQQLRLATQAHRAGRLDEAISAYLRLLAVRPYHAELHNNLGVALRLIGKLEASVSHHRLSLTSDPGNPALHSNLGNALRAAGRLDESVKHHFQSIALNRDYAEGFFNLALCLRDLGRIDEAVGCLGRALALNPDNRRARTELAIALMMRGELEVGFAAYEARKRLPETPAVDFYGVGYQDVRNRLPKITSTMAELQWRPKIDMTTALRRIFESYRGHVVEARALLEAAA